MANWLYTLKIRDLLADDKLEGSELDAHVAKIAPEIVKRIRVLLVAVSDDDRPEVDGLWDELDEAKDAFEELSEGDLTDAKSEFNCAMELLYDIGDDGHRVWIK